MIDKNKITAINAVIKTWFDNHSQNRIAAKDLMPQFITAGIFTADRNGLPIRNVLRELDCDNQLNLIPYVFADRKQKYTYWFFIRHKEGIFLGNQNTRCQ